MVSLAGDIATIFTLLSSSKENAILFCRRGHLPTALGEAAGADPKTFAGLAGVGDLIATCGSPLSRNYTFGSNLGKGLSVEEATKVSNGVAEGVPTTDAVVALGKQYGVPTPLATAMSHVLSDGISCAQMLSELFGEGISEE